MVSKFSLGSFGKGPQRKFLWGLIAAAAVIFLYFFAIAPLVEAKKSADQEISLKRRNLIKYTEILQDRRTAETALERTLKQNQELEKKLLPGETSQLVAASLQDLVKRLSEKYGVGLRSFRNLDPKDLGIYRKISLQIEFNPINSIQNLSQFINELEHQERTLMITEMDLLVFNPRMPNNIQGSMVITGLMKGSKIKEGKERGKEK